MNCFMASFLANTAPDPAKFPVPENALDKLWYGLQVTVVGLGTVFFVLFLLMAVVYLFKLFFYTIPQKNVSKKSEEPKTTVVQESFTVDEDSENDEIAAVIAAAVASIYAGAPSATSRQLYKIKSF